MRKKIAKRWRKEVLRRGGVILKEGIVIKPGERKALGLPRSKQGYEVNFHLNGWTYCVADPYDALGAYKILLECLDLDLEADDASD